MITKEKAAPSNGAITSQALAGVTLADVLLDAAGKVDSVLRRNIELERENNMLRQELASAHARADAVRREAMAAVDKVLSERGVT
jgi:hypothetical protein